MTFEELTQTWTGEKIIAHQYERQRKKYAFYRAKLSEVELLNKEARESGTSYTERKKYSKQITVLQTLMQEAIVKGNHIKAEMRANRILPADFVFSENDMGMINRYGVELFLNIQELLYV